MIQQSILLGLYLYCIGFYIVHHYLYPIILSYNCILYIAVELLSVLLVLYLLSGAVVESNEVFVTVCVREGYDQSAINRVATTTAARTRDRQRQSQSLTCTFTSPKN